MTNIKTKIFSSEPATKIIDFRVGTIFKLPEFINLYLVTDITNGEYQEEVKIYIDLQTGISEKLDPYRRAIKVKEVLIQAYTQ